MDTDDLSREAYKAIIVEAERFNHDLTLQFGLLSYHCQNEAEYIEDAKKLIAHIQSLDEYDLDYMFFGAPPTRESLQIVLEKILVNISDVEKIPLKKRQFDF
jgi:hypothetical protein